MPEPKQLAAINQKIKAKHGRKKKSKNQRNSIEIVPGKQSSFRTISRGTYYRVNSMRDLPPPCGYYNINYDLVDKNVPSKRLELDPVRSQSIFQKIPNLDIDYPDIKRLDKQKGYIDFKKISPRGPFEKLQEKGNPHEKRFDVCFPLIIF